MFLYLSGVKEENPSQIHVRKSQSPKTPTQSQDVNSPETPKSAGPKKKVFINLLEFSTPNFDLDSNVDLGIDNEVGKMSQSDSLECLNDKEGFVPPNQIAVPDDNLTWSEWSSLIESGALNCAVDDILFNHDVDSWSFDDSIFAQPEPIIVSEKPLLSSKKCHYKYRKKICDSVTNLLDHWMLKYNEGDYDPKQIVFEKGRNWCNNEQIYELLSGDWLSAEV